VWHLDRLLARFAEFGLEGVLPGLIAQQGAGDSSQWSSAPARELVEEPPGEVHGLRAQFFADSSFGQPILLRYDRGLTYDWGTRSLCTAVPAQGLAARWTGWIKPSHKGRYRFILRARGAASFWLDDQDCLAVGQPDVLERKYEVDLDNKPHAVRLEFHKTG